MSKVSKHRLCPAVQREIASAECGENRHSRFACPVGCEFNPFSPANYASCLEIESRLSRKTYDWYLASFPNPGEGLRQLDKLMRDDPGESLALQMREFYFRRDADGQTVAERWQKAGFPGLKNDERTIQLTAMRPQLRLIEVHRVIDDVQTEVVDLFDADPRPFLVCDRGLAARACRFTVLLAWFHPLPHFWRCSGFAATIVPATGFDPVEWVDQIVRHLGGPPWSVGRARWFGENFIRFQQSLKAVGLARREQMFASMDADFGKVVYELRAPFAECRSVVDALSEVVPDDLADGERDEGFAEARTWLESGGTGNEVCGRILLGQSHWRVEAMGAGRLARLRESLEKTLGPRVKFVGERRDDLAAHLRSKAPAYDKDLVPPALLASPGHLSLSTSRIRLPPGGTAPDSLSDVYESRDRQWVDAQLPALDGKTPRQAATDPELRPRLILLLKERVRGIDEHDLRHGARTDANWLLRELGANELVFDPPPPRQSREMEVLDEEIEDDDLAADEYSDHLVPWEALPPKAFTLEEARERAFTGIDQHPSFVDAVLTAEKAGCFLLGDFPEVLGDRVTDNEFTFIGPLLIEIWFALVPYGCFGPDIPAADLQADFDRLLGPLQAYAAGHSHRESLAFATVGCAQPGVLALVFDQFDHHLNSAVPEERPRPETQLILALALRVAIDQLDRHLREDSADEA